MTDTIYDLSQGITSVAVALFMLCQKHSLGNEEKITISGLKKVAGNDLRMIKNMIDALRNNNIRALAQYEDLVVDISQLMKEYRPEPDMLERIKRIKKANSEIRTVDKLRNQTGNQKSKTIVKS